MNGIHRSLAAWLLLSQGAEATTTSPEFVSAVLQRYVTFNRWAVPRLAPSVWAAMVVVVRRKHYFVETSVVCASMDLLVTQANQTSAACSHLRVAATTKSTPVWNRPDGPRHNLRRLQDQETCDAAFVACLESSNCVECFVELESKVSLVEPFRVLGHYNCDETR